MNYKKKWGVGHISWCTKNTAASKIRNKPSKKKKKRKKKSQIYHKANLMHLTGGKSSTRL